MISLIEPGLFTTVQDLGRESLGHLGVPRAGAADAFSLRVANRLVGNVDGVGGLEVTGRGGLMRFDAAAHIALAGGAIEAGLDGQPVPAYQTINVPAGAELTLGPIHAGWRTYLAIAGGLKLPPVLGSVSTDTLSGLGPMPLAAGMRLNVGTHAADPAFYMRGPPQYTHETRLRILAGPQQDWFTGEATAALLQGEYRVLAQSDRTGLRLEGPRLPRRNDAELPSQGMVAGALQVPRDGQPIALLPNHGATGGYPVIANVISADLGALAQLPPGARLRFELVTRDAALAALRAQEERLERDIIAADAGLLAARALMALANRHASLQQAAVSDGKRRIRIRRGR